MRQSRKSLAARKPEVPMIKRSFSKSATVVAPAESDKSVNQSQVLKTSKSFVKPEKKAEGSRWK